MSKKSKREISKKIIDFLKKKCCSREELKELLKKELPKLSPGAVRKRVERYSNELVELGLVDKRGHKYCWYVYINPPDRETYDKKLLHSRNLIPALRQIAGITWPRYTVMPSEKIVSADDMGILEKCVEDHLRAYPKIWKIHKDYRKKKRDANDRKEMFCTNLMEKLRKKFGNEYIVETRKGSKYRSFVGSNIPLLIYGHILYDSSSQLNLDGEKIWLSDSLVAKGSHLFNQVREFIKREIEDEFNNKVAKRNKKIERDATEIRQVFEQEIRKLILRIESGSPLLGGCEICL